MLPCFSSSLRVQVHFSGPIASGEEEQTVTYKMLQILLSSRQSMKGLTVTTKGHIRLRLEP